MSEVILNLVQSKKKKRSKNLCSTRDLVAKLFIAILVNSRYRGAGCVGWYGNILFYRSCCRAGGYFFYLVTACLRRDGSSKQS
jgi:hypothetical protein